jgi:hypothetical protein
LLVLDTRSIYAHICADALKVKAKAGCDAAFEQCEEISQDFTCPETKREMVFF